MRSFDGLAQVQGVATGDLNGDGLTDVAATTGYMKSQVQVYYQTADGRLRDPLVIDPSVSARRVRVGDVNGDHRADVVVMAGKTLRIYTQLSGGTLSTARIITFSSTPSDLVLGDLNGDGRIDLVVSTDGGIRQLLQHADGTLGYPTTLAPTTNAWQLHLSDVNSDGQPDLVYEAGNAAWAIRYQGPAGVFGSEVDVASTRDPSLGGGSIAVGDMNGDGRDDLAFAAGGNVPNAFLYLTYQNPDGTFGPVQVFPAYQIPGEMTLADVDGDGRKDLVLGHWAYNKLSVYRQGLSGIAGTYELIDHSYDHDLVVADINGDGMPDAVSAAYNGELSISYGAIRNDGPRATDNATTAYQGRPTSLSPAAWDPDGDPLTYTVDQLPQHGTLSGVAPALVYTPAGGYVGPDSMHYTVTDGLRKWASATTSITVVAFGSISGVVDDGYQRVGGITVTLSSSGPSDLAGGTVRTTTTAADGSYRFDDVGVGPEYLEFTDPTHVFMDMWYSGPTDDWQTRSVYVDSGQSVVANASLLRTANFWVPLRVTTTTDGGWGSLRQAVGWANAAPGDDIIVLQPDQLYRLGCGEGGELVSRNGHLKILGNGATIVQTCPANRVIDDPTNNGGTAALVLDHLTITGGDATACGGGAFAAGGLELDDSTVIANTTTGNGGGVCSPIFVESFRSTITGNTAGDKGGGIYSDIVNLDNSTVDGNAASGGGGGLATEGAGVGFVHLTYSTITNNSSPVWGANTFGSMYGSAVGSVIAYPQGGTPNCWGSYAAGTSAGANYSDDASCGLTAGTDVQNGADPQLSALADHGGPTRTRMPSPTSPLLDRGLPGSLGCTGAVTDERGVGRPQDSGCDAGAVETAPNATTIAGRITDGSTGLAGLIVVAVSISPIQIVQTTTTDASGHFVLSGLASGTFKLAFVDPNWLHGIPGSYLPRFYGMEDSIVLADMWNSARFVPTGTTNLVDTLHT